MKIKAILLLVLMWGMTLNISAQHKMNHKDNTQRIVRIAEIEVFPEYLDAYLTASSKVARLALAEEPGVICLFPTQTKEDKTKFRIIEIYASDKDYQHHLTTPHFLEYKQSTAQMVKSLKLVDLNPLDTTLIADYFKRK